MKAGLPPGAWRDGARILLFEAQVFGERLLM
jgi:AMMECR1 domain-containing protein